MQARFAGLVEVHLAEDPSSVARELELPGESLFGRGQCGAELRNAGHMRHLAGEQSWRDGCRRANCSVRGQSGAFGGERSLFG